MAVSDFIEDITGLVVDEEGEIIECGPDSLVMLAQRRHKAKTQEKRWEETRRNYDRLILKVQEEKRAVYGGLVLSVRFSPDITKTDGDAFAEAINTLPLEIEDMFQIIGAARSFDRKKLPERVLDAYDASTTVRPGTAWLDSKEVLEERP